MFTIPCDAFEVHFCFWRQTNCNVQWPLLVYLEIYCSIFWTNELFHKLFTFPAPCPLQINELSKNMENVQDVDSTFLFFKPQQPLKSCSDRGFTVTGVGFYSVQLRNRTVAPCPLCDSQWVHVGGLGGGACLLWLRGKNRETKTKDKI